MFAQYFAGYLFEKNILTKKQLVDGLKSMKKSRVKLGVLAINAGYLTVEQVEQLHRKQTAVDMRFGDLAVDMGFLTQKQVDELLAIQPSQHLLLAQTLVDHEYIKNIQLANALNEFKSKYDLTDFDMSNMDEKRAIAFITKYYNLAEEKNADKIASYIVLLLNNLIRFIGDDFVPIELDRRISCSDAVCIEQNISGELPFHTMLEGDEITYIQFASRFAGEEIPVFDEYSKAAGADFLNLQNGLYMVNMSNNHNIELKLHPTSVKIGDSDYDNGMCCIPIMYAFGNVNFVIGNES